MKKIVLLQKFGLKRGRGGGVGGLHENFCWRAGLIMNRGGENIFKKGGLTRKR